MEPSEMYSVLWMFAFIAILFIALLIEEGVNYLKRNHRLTLDKFIFNMKLFVERVSNFSKSVQKVFRK